MLLQLNCRVMDLQQHQQQTVVLAEVKGRQEEEERGCATRGVSTWRKTEPMTVLSNFKIYRMLQFAAIRE